MSAVLPETGFTSSPFVDAQASIAKVMRQVIYALVPGIAVYVYFFGWGVLFNISLAVSSALVFEAVMLKLRNKPLQPFITDGSAILTAILLALALPPLLPWWLPVVGSFFAIVMAKHLYGGIGYNTFNPAMAAYAILLISFPRELSMWQSAIGSLPVSMSLVDISRYVFIGVLPENVTFDAISSATLLDALRTGTGLGQSINAIRQAATTPVFGKVAGHGFEWVSLAFLAGGLWLMFKKIISWHIPFSLLLGMAAIAGIFYVIDSQHYADPFLHLLGGATILGAFFIATDPVTASTTPLGKIIYGAGIAVLTYAIRQWGGYPDGIAFGVLLMGLTVPLLDYYTTPRVFGARQHKEKA